MVGDPGQEQRGQTRGIDKGKEPMTISQQTKKSPSRVQQEEERTKFHAKSIRIPSLRDYVNLRLEDETIVLPFVADY